MDKTQHTPGPWITWKLAPDSDPDERTIVTTADGQTEICGPIEVEANARLIAQAPALLDELIKVKTELAYLYHNRGINATPANRKRIGEMILQAEYEIEKALPEDS